jgi:hypothetical protein
MNECHREQSRALERAAEIERLGTPLAAASALRVCMTYHAYRGQKEQTQHYRRLLELSAIQNGTSWQVEWLSLPIEGLASATWTDLFGLRRAVERLDRLVVEVPSFVHMRDAIRLGYRFRRGDFAEAAGLGDTYIMQHPPMTIIGWASAYAITALAHVELGQVERAREICELNWASGLLVALHRAHEARRAQRYVGVLRDSSSGPCVASQPRIPLRRYSLIAFHQLASRLTV